MNAKQIRKRKKTSQKQRRVVKSSAGLWLRAQPNLRAAGHWLLGIFTGLWLDTTLGLRDGQQPGTGSAACPFPHPLTFPLIPSPILFAPGGQSTLSPAFFLAHILATTLPSFPMCSSHPIMLLLLVIGWLNAADFNRSALCPWDVSAGAKEIKVLWVWRAFDCAAIE